eukprot:5520741-Prymnesium_polylepis.1
MCVRAQERLETVRLPADRNEITVECVRHFLVDPPTAGAENTAPDWAQPAPVQRRPRRRRWAQMLEPPGAARCLSHRA